MLIHVVKTGQKSYRNCQPDKSMYCAWIETADGRQSPKVNGYTRNVALFELLEFYGEKYGCPLRVVN